MMQRDTPIIVVNMYAAAIMLNSPDNTFSFIALTAAACAWIALMFIIPKN